MRKGFVVFTLSRVPFALLICAALFALSVSAEAQQTGKIVGILGDAPPSGLDAFRNGLRDLGWVEGKNLAIDYRPHAGKVKILSGIATESVQLKTDVIVAPGTVFALAAKQATRTISIVMLSSDPVGSGLVASLAQPDGNTGLSNVQVELAGSGWKSLRKPAPRFLAWLSFCV